MSNIKLNLKLADFKTVLQLYKIFEDESIVYSVKVEQNSRTKVNSMGTPCVTCYNVYNIEFSVSYCSKLLRALVDAGDDEDLQLVKVIADKMQNLLCGDENEY